jgi:hypothetical protein
VREIGGREIGEGGIDGRVIDAWTSGERMQRMTRCAQSGGGTRSVNIEYEIQIASEK